MEINNKNNYNVNWIDGMKINKNHFIQMESSLQEAIHNSSKSFLSPVNYGLLPDFSSNNLSLDMSVSIDGQDSINVTLNKCLAITLSGCKINITKDSKKYLEESGNILKHQYTTNKDEKQWYIILLVNPYGRIPVGDADPEEEPPRKPYVLPEYKINILPANEVTNKGMGMYHIKLGKLNLIEGKPVLDQDYIPPCTSIQSHPDLKVIFDEIGTFFNNMEAYSLHTIQKIHQKKQSNELAKCTLFLTSQVGQYLHKILSEYRIKDEYEPPYAMLSKLMSLARVIKSSLDVYTGTGKEDFLNYLTDWCDLNQGAFENVLVDLIENKYNHSDINDSLIKVASFSKLMLSLFKKLNELDYIGKKSDPNIFVKEEVVDDDEVKGRRSFLFD